MDEDGLQLVAIAHPSDQITYNDFPGIGVLILAFLYRMVQTHIYMYVRIHNKIVNSSS